MRGMVFAASPKFAREKSCPSWRRAESARHSVPKSVSGKRIGVELTKWVEHDQITENMRRKLLEDSYLKIIDSEKESDQRSNRLGSLRDKSERIRSEHLAQVQ